MPGIARRSLAVGLLCFTAYLLLTFCLYGSILTAWWCCDDPQILKHALRYSPWEYFTVPEAWRALVPYSLTPWLTLTYDLDHLFFGPNPTGYYIHSLITIVLCACLICLIARQWVSGWYAFGGGVLFLVGAPVMVASHQLMVRHYIEGLFFYLIALWVLLWAFQRKNSRLGWLAGISFAIAATAKEIYLPLGILLFLLPIGNFRQRLKTGWPLLLVMLLYIPWRWYMLGDLVGGYTPAVALDQSDLMSAVVQFGTIPSLLLAWPWLSLSGMMLCIGLAIRRTRQGWLPLLLLFLSIALLAPLIPLARHPGIGAGSERYFIALWAVVAMGTALLTGSAAAGRGMRSHLFGGLLMVLLTGSAWQHADAVRVAMLPYLQEQFTQGKALITVGEQDIIYLTSGIAPWYLSGIVDLQREFGRHSPSPCIVSDEIDLDEQVVTGRILHYDAASNRMVDHTQQVPQLLATWRQRIQSRPLAVMMEFDPFTKTLHWQLGPYRYGHYTLLPKIGRQPLPPEGTLRMEKVPEGTFRFRYDDPEGWSTYTPLLRFTATPRGTSRLTMQGPGLTLAEISGHHKK